MNKLRRIALEVLLFCLPFLALVILYLVIDPFMILYHYDDFNSRTYIHKNRDYISSEMYFTNSVRYNYDSFIFGSSAALYTSPGIWREFLEDGSVVYSFDASGENIAGIWSKIKYIDSTGHGIRNALITIDRATFSPFVNKVPIFMKHYKVYRSSKLFFHYNYFLYFPNLKFFIAWTHYCLSHTFHPYMEDILISEPYYYDPVSNEYFNTGILQELKKDSIGYYTKRINKFPHRSGHYEETKSLIDDQEIAMLKEIKNIFAKDSTNYRVLICPSYDQISYNMRDKGILEAVFGHDNVYDFSGINPITQEMSNFYDGFHFKKYVGREMLEHIYRTHQR